MLLHIQAVHLDVDSKNTTVWHKLTPRTRILCAALMVFAIALTPNGRWLTWAIYGLAIVYLLFVSQITLSVLGKRLAVEMTFVSVVLLGTLFRGGGEVLWSWGPVQITTVGLIVLGSVTLKALLSLLVMNLLTLTTSVSALLNGLLELRMPPLLVATLASMYRYINVLVDEFSAMRRAAVSRNLMGSKRWQRLVIGNIIGALFIRTYERGDRIYQAMLSRGYQGLAPGNKTLPGGKRDVLALTLTFVLALLGQSVYLPL